MAAVAWSGSCGVALAEPARTGAPEKPLVDTICPLMERQAELNGLPPVYFIRLIWRESRFRPRAVSHKGAQGIAQFMPATAKERGLADPFDPESAILHSAKLLADLKRELGNLGLAAAAYNAGADRVKGWLTGSRTLPKETRDYVRFVTGRSAEHWKAENAALPEEIAAKPLSLQLSCRRMAPRLVHAVNPKDAPPPPPPVVRSPWGVQIGAGFDRASVEAILVRVRKQHARLLANARAMFVSETNLSRGSRALVVVRLAAESRSEAQTLCEKLRAAGGACVVKKN